MGGLIPLVGFPDNAALSDVGPGILGKETFTLFLLSLALHTHLAEPCRNVGCAPLKF